MTDRDRDYAIRTILAEAEGEGPEGMAAVANIIRNRQATGHWGDTAAGVVTARSQFEPWAHAGTGRDNDPLRYSPGEDRYQRAARIYDAVQSGQYADPTKGATHFISKGLQKELGRDMPDWTRTLTQTAQLGNHTFYVDPSLSRGAAITGRGKPMLDDSTGGMGSPGGAMPPQMNDWDNQIKQAQAQYWQRLANPQQRTGLLGQLLFGQGGLHGVMQQHLPNGLLGRLFGAGKPQQAMPQPPGAGVQPPQHTAPPPMLANAPLPNFGGAPQSAPTQDSAVRGPWSNALSGFLGGIGMG